MPSRLPPLRIPEALEQWLRAEGEKNGLQVGEMARMLLLEAMRRNAGGTRQE